MNLLTCILDARSLGKYTLGDVPPVLLHMLPLPCSPSKSLRFSDLPTTSTAEIRTEKRAPVLQNEKCNIDYPTNSTT